MLESFLIIAGLALFWAIFPIGMIYSVYKLDIETGAIKDHTPHDKGPHGPGEKVSQQHIKNSPPKDSAA